MNKVRASLTDGFQPPDLRKPLSHKGLHEGQRFWPAGFATHFSRCGNIYRRKEPRDTGRDNPHMNTRWKPSVTVAAIIERDGRYLLVEEHTPEGLRLNLSLIHI